MKKIIAVSVVMTLLSGFGLVELERHHHQLVVSANNHHDHVHPKHHKKKRRNRFKLKTKP